MRSANNLEKIESQIMDLPVSEQIHLIERIARRVRSVQSKAVSYTHLTLPTISSV